MSRTFFLGLCTSLIFSSMAFAGLGLDETSCNDEARIFNAKTHSVTTHDKYKLHTLTLNNGMVIKEYVAPGGAVFAVTWRGTSFHPHFDNLFGAHFAEYQAHASEMPRVKGHRFNTLKTQNIVLTMGGHMGSISGMVYAPKLIPAGLSLDEML